ncbi:MAG: DUF1553 domain-containing protein [Acidobacteria bacterium]|nr:DUF1553 domain-containing protein [Acidobacteriota bacterium]
MRLALILTASAAAASAAPLSFVKDVMPIINKASCTSGPCHGGAKGKNGFKLSLRGYDPEFDYRAIVHEMQGRRLNRIDPANSLILLKPSMSIAHGGGMRLDPKSAYYNTVLQWISEGAPFGDAAAGAVTHLDVQPAEFFAAKPGLEQQLKVIAHYADGSSRDVARDAGYSSNTPQQADVTEAGVIKTIRRGESATLVRYEGKLSVVNVTAVSDAPFTWTASPEYNYVDKHVNAKLQRLKIQPSDLASDAEFLRRVSYDLVGQPPSPQDVRAFVADKTETRRKRSALIEKLLARDEFVNHWSVKWSDLLQVNRAKLGDKGVWAFREWIRESLGANRPYDQMVRELLTARGSTFKNPPANFFRFTREPKVAMETTTQLFLGVRMVCAQCHDHPFEQWTQNQYYNLSAFFGQLAVKTGEDSDEEVIYDKREEFEIHHPKDNRVMPAKFLFPVQQTDFREAELRESLADWVTSKSNPLFAKSMANRMWSYFMGRGIIDPVDDIRASNPPSNPALLDALTQDFAARHYDLKHLIRTIVNSRSYQLSYKATASGEGDEINFSHALPRRLSAEQLFDGVYLAAGVRPKLANVPTDSLAQDLPDPSIAKGGFLDVFGRPERQTSCECERRADVSLVQALNLLNGSTISDAIAAPEGRIARLVLAGASDRKLVEEIYLAALNRQPEGNELDLALTYLGKPGAGRAERAQDLMWALLNSNAFLFNR